MTRAQKLAQLKALAPEVAEALGADASIAAIDEALAVAEASTRGQLTRIDEAVSSPALSFEDRCSLVRDAVERKYSEDRAEGRLWAWVRMTFTDSVVFAKGRNLYQVSYSIADNGDVEFGAEASRVILTPTPADASVAAESVESAHLARALKVFPGAVFGAVAEAEGVEFTGARWDAVIITAGESLNSRYYSRAVLEAALPLYEGAKIYRDHDESGRRFGRTVDDLIGFFDQVRPAMLTLEAKGPSVYAVVGRANFTDATVRARMLEAWRLGKPDLYGFSHAINGKIGKGERNGRAVEMVETIATVRSVDLVTTPAAGGRATGVIESVSEVNTSETRGDKAMREKLMARLKLLRPDMVESLGANPTEEALLEALDKALEKAPAATDGRPAPAAPGTADTDARYEALARQLSEVNRTLAMSRVDSVINESTLPNPLKDRLRKDFDRRVSAGETITREMVAEAIEAEKKVYGSVVESVTGRALPGAGGAGLVDIQFGAGRPEKINEALDDFFNPEKPATSFRQLYVTITGDSRVTGRLDEAVRLHESIGTSTFDKALGDSIHRRMIQDYKRSSLNAWRLIANVVRADDFRTRRKIRVGGYGVPEAVAQGAPYLAFATPDDEEVTYTVGKYGGIESVTLEAIRNDDAGVIRRIPSKLARAFARGVHEFVFDHLADNVTIYDSVALAANGHTNIVTTAMSDANIESLRLKMKQQTEAGSGERLSLAPKYLFVPSNLEKLAWQLTQANKQIAASNPDSVEGALPNYVGQMGLQPVTIDYWTDPTNYWLSASLDQCGLIEIAFLDGKEDPEILVQDAPSYGSMFTHDAITYKGRHIYGGAVEEYRGFAAGIVSD